MSFVDLPKSSWLDLLRFRDDLLSRERYSDPKCLIRSAYKAYSQCDEDGIIAEIFSRIGTTNKNFVEIGVETGIECNTLWLLMQGWRGTWIEGNPSYTEIIERSHRHWVEGGHLTSINALVNAENINLLLERIQIAGELDFFSLDIDLNDYWVWEALTECRPRVIYVEYNAIWPPPVKLTVKYYKESSWSRTNHFGASLSAYSDLASRKGYKIVAYSISGSNAFFVREDLCADHFYKPGDVEAHYEPARYFLTELPWGHPPGVAETVLL